MANTIVDQVESDNIVIVCTDADACTIETFTKQISWGQRVRGIIKESDLELWYNKCMRGRYANELAKPLKNLLIHGFQKEFPQTQALLMDQFFNERGYSHLRENDFWSVPITTQ